MQSLFYQMTNQDLRQSLHLKLIEYLFNSKGILILIPLVIILIFRLMGFHDLPSIPIIIILFFEAFVFSSYYILRRGKAEVVMAYNILSLWLDILGLTICLHFLGGLYSMVWAAVYLIFVAVSSIFMSKNARISYVFYICVVYTSMCYLEHYGIITRWNIFQVPVSDKLDMVSWLSTISLITIIAFVSNNFLEILTGMQRLASLGRMSTEIAHEMRTPLQIIEGVAETHCGEVGKKEMGVQIERLSRFVKEVMALGREEIQSCSNTRIQAVVDQAIGLVVKTIEPGKDIQIEKAYFEEETWVSVDIDQMLKAFANLIRNGVDSIEKNGRLWVRISQNGFEWVQVEIEDTGVGIYEHELNIIFEPFYTTKTGIRGVGLGLAIAKKFIEANGGHIEVSSRVGKGSKFIVNLPLVS